MKIRTIIVAILFIISILYITGKIRMEISDIACVLVCVVSIASFVLIYSAYDAAEKRGYGDSNKSLKIAKLIKVNGKNHIVEEEYEPQIGDIVIYVKYGCFDCMNTYSTLHQFAQENRKIYFISSRSKIGKDLRGNYPTQVVPSAVIIGIPKKAWDLSDVDVNQDELQRLIELRNKYLEKEKP